MTIGGGLAAPTMLRRRDLLRGGAAAMALGSVSASRKARGSGAGRILKMGYTLARASQYEAGANAFSRQLEATLGGTWRVEQYPGGILGGESEMLTQLQKGELDLGFISAVSSVIPEFGVFDLPFLFRDAPHARAVLDGPIGQAYLDKFLEHGLIGLAWGENGMRHLTNSKHPVREPADLRGLRLRVPPSDVMLGCFRQLGADAVTLGFPALYGALESGRFDGQENPIAVIRTSHFERVQTHLTLTAHVYSTANIIMSKDLWDDLGAGERDGFVAAARAGGLVSRQVAERFESEGVQALRDAGMEVVPTVDRATFLAALQPVWSQFAAQFGKERIARMRA